jgi:hypothetical protein
VPTLVEVKRGTHTRIRREVVGQMLDYAANAVLYWPIERLRGFFEETCEREGTSAEVRLSEHLGDTSPDEFWMRVKTNLQAGRIRMVFVADRIPSELRRIVEFLNEQMDPAEVLAIEVRQFVGEGRRTLVPKMIGETAESQKKKSTGAREQKRWNEEMFLEALADRSAIEAEVAREILAWARAADMWIWWGKGRIDGSAIPVLDHDGLGHTLLAMWTNGTVAIQFGYMKNRPVFDDPALRIELAKKLSEIPGVNIPVEATERFPSVRLETLQESEVRRRFLEVMKWALDTIREEAGKSPPLVGT